MRFVTLRSISKSSPWILLVLAAGIEATAQSTGADDAAINKAALDYIEGWYTADAARMERALHPDLAKRIVMTNPQNGRNAVNHQSAMTLVQGTRAGGGSKTPADRQMKEVTVLDRFNNAAVAKIVASDWIDYLQLGKVNGEWKIINVLWELKPKPASESTK